MCVFLYYYQYSVLLESSQVKWGIIMIVLTHCDVRTYGLYRIVREEGTNSFQTIMLADGLAWLWTNENDRLIGLDDAFARPVRVYPIVVDCVLPEEWRTNHGYCTNWYDTIWLGLAWLGLAKSMHVYPPLSEHQHETKFHIALPSGCGCSCCPPNLCTSFCLQRYWYDSSRTRTRTLACCLLYMTRRRQLLF